MVPNRDSWKMFRVIEDYQGKAKLCFLVGLRLGLFELEIPRQVDTRLKRVISAPEPECQDVVDVIS